MIARAMIFLLTPALLSFWRAADSIHERMHERPNVSWVHCDSIACDAHHLITRSAEAATVAILSRWGSPGFNYRRKMREESNGTER